ncbi:MAG: DUF3794 domain-containing protein [Oscillospiraceae bacterium]|nr:DUF3794 domain-containing protein [Oscillospiraceae bacterium]
MDIELLKETVEYENYIGEFSNECMFRGDYLIPDIEPDVYKILMVDAKPWVKSIDVMDGRVAVQGDLHFNIIYSTVEDENTLVRSVSYEDKFSCAIDIPSGGKEIRTEVFPFIEFINSSIINERKINIDGILQLKVLVSNREKYEIVKEVSGNEKLQLLRKPFNLDVYKGMYNNDIILKENIHILGDKPSIDKVLKLDAIITKRDFKVYDNKIYIEGYLTLVALYSGKENSGVYTVENEIQFTKDIEIENATESLLVDSRFRINNIYFELKQNDQGEDKIISVEVLIKSAVNIIQKSIENIVDDAYSPVAKFNIEKDNIPITNVSHLNKWKLIIKEDIEVEKKMPESILYSMASPDLVQKNLIDDKILLEGVINLCAIYKVRNENNYDSIKCQIPFTSTIDVIGVNPDMKLAVLVFLDGLSVDVEGKNIAVKTLLDINYKIFQIENTNLITQVNETDEVIPQKDYSMTIYTVQDDENLWDISKKFNVLMDDIIKANNLEKSELKSGNKIIILGKSII